MCKFKLFSIAAAALMMVACSNEDLTQQTQTKAGKMQFSATIAAPSSGATTRTIYTEDTQNKKITVAWKVDDEIALVHNGVKDVATVKTINSDGSATITGYVTGATNNADVRLVYPAARVGTVTGGADGTEYTADETVEGKLKTQDGTLAYIQDNLDFREDLGHLAVNGTEVTLAEKAGDISPLLAIWKLTLSDGTNNLSATQVKIKGGESVLASTTTLTAGTSVVTLAIPTDVFIDGALTIEATVGDDTYAYTKAEGAKFNPGTYYQSTVTMAKIVDLSTVTTATTIEDGYTVTGTLGANVKISIADGAIVTLDGVTITGENNSDYKWAGITCEGDATIILKDDTENTVNGFHQNYPGIYVPSEMTLTIKGETKGTGKLTASSNGNGAGIGGRMSMDCGNIEIQGGVITATGSSYAAGIGGANSSSCGTITISGGTITANGGDWGAGIGSGGGTCGNITISGGTVTANGGNKGAGIGSGGGGTCGDISISGGTIKATGGTDAAGIGSGTGTEGCGAITISGGSVTATGGEQGAGIGSGYEGTCTTITISGGTVTATGGNGNGGAGIGTGDEGSCGNITITTGVTKVTATKGSSADNSIGKATNHGNGNCGTVTIGGVNTGAISTSPYTYDPNAPALNLTSPAVGQVIGSDGKNYAAASVPSGVTKVAMIAYVNGSNGLAIALADESSSMNWSTAISTCAAHTPAFTGGTWKLATKDEWTNMITAAGSYTALRDGFTSVGGSNLLSDVYWSSTESGSGSAWV